MRWSAPKFTGRPNTCNAAAPSSFWRVQCGVVADRRAAARGVVTHSSAPRRPPCAVRSRRVPRRSRALFVARRRGAFELAAIEAYGATLHHCARRSLRAKRPAPPVHTPRAILVHPYTMPGDRRHAPLSLATAHQCDGKIDAGDRSGRCGGLRPARRFALRATAPAPVVPVQNLRALRKPRRRFASGQRARRLTPDTPSARPARHAGGGRTAFCRRVPRKCWSSTTPDDRRDALFGRD